MAHILVEIRKSTHEIKKKCLLFEEFQAIDNNSWQDVYFPGQLRKLGWPCKKAYEPDHEKTCLMSFANNKGADQHAHPQSPISAFVVRCLDNVMSLVSVTKISSLMLASVAEQASLSLTWSETPEDTFSHDEAHIRSSTISPVFCPDTVTV